MSGNLRVSIVTALACLLAFLAGTASGASQPKRVAFLVTLKASVIKDWDTVTVASVTGCQTSQRSVGRRTVRLRSARPTTVFVTLNRGRVSYPHAIVRYVRVQLSQTGSQTATFQAPCKERTLRSPCMRARRAVSGARFGFFRSARNELSFRAAPLPEFAKACPAESSSVRGIRPSLRDAQGELSEAALMNPAIPSQTAIGSVDVETDLDGRETGRVIERVSWELTFTRKH